MIKTRLLFWLLTLLCVATTAGPAFASPRYNGAVGAKVFALNTPDLGCSATLMLLQKQCILMTAKHCVKNQSSATLSAAARPIDASLVPYFPSLAEMGNTAWTVPVIKVSPTYDLAQLAIPPILKKEFCDSGALLNVYPLSVQSISDSPFSAVSMGVIQGRPQVDLTGGCLCETRSAIPITLSPEANDLILSLPELEIHPFMSGGPTLSDLTWPRRPIGINTHFIRFEDTGGITPISTIAAFLRQPGAPLTNKPAKKTFPKGIAELLPDNALQIAGGNSESSPGGNSQSSPGGNSQSSPGGNRKVISDQSVMKGLREPDEGVPLPSDPEKVLLAVRVNGEWRQIDGYDDLKNIYLPHASELGPRDLITRPKAEGGYPDFRARRNILKRLEGQYSDGPVGVTYEEAISGQYNRQVSRQVEYVEDPNHPEGWRLKTWTHASDSINVNARTGTIKLSLGSRTVHLEGAGGIVDLATMKPKPARTLTFHIRFSDQSAKTMTLTRDGKSSWTLHCDNHNFLKLVCSNATYTFSLSRNREKGGKLSFRLGKIVGKEGSGKRIVRHEFGKLEAGSKQVQNEKGLP